MNKKTIIILSTAIILLLAGAGFFWIYSKSKTGEAPFEEGSVLSKIFPFAGQRDFDGDLQYYDDGSLNISAREAGALVQLTQNSVSGAAAKNSTVMYIEKSTGHVYEVFPDGTQRSRLSNTTILRIFEVFWSYDAEKFIAEYFDEERADGSGYLSARFLSASVSTTTDAAKGVILPQSAFEAAVSPSEEKIFYLSSEDDSAYVAGITADFSNKKQRQILTIPFAELNASWPAKNIIALATKPSAVAEGSLYFLNAITEDFQKILGGVNGLTALVSPSVDNVIYSQSANKAVETKILNIKERVSKDFELITLPEKCVWSGIEDFVVYCAAPKIFPRADYPDEWYQGLISFGDSIWKINVSSGETAVLLSESDIDAVKLFLSASEDYLFFVNKKDGTLWSLKIK